MGATYRVFRRGVERKQAKADAHAGQVLVKYWRGTTACERWCADGDDLESALQQHSNAYPPTFFDADENETDYEGACAVLGVVPCHED